MFIQDRGEEPIERFSQRFSLRFSYCSYTFHHHYVNQRQCHYILLCLTSTKPDIRIKISTDTLLFTLHESCIAMTNVILPKCVSTNYDIKDTLLFPHIIVTSTLHRRCITMSLAERVVQNAGAHTITSRETLFI